MHIITVSKVFDEIRRFSLQTEFLTLWRTKIYDPWGDYPRGSTTLSLQKNATLIVGIVITVRESYGSRIDTQYVAIKMEPNYNPNPNQINQSINQSFSQSSKYLTLCSQNNNSSIKIWRKKHNINNTQLY